jgi:hypothetical protein
LRLRHLKFTVGTISGGRKLSDFLLNILPACTNLVELKIDGEMEKWFKTGDPTGSAAAIWISRLEKYRGPPYPLNYLRDGAPLYQLTSKAGVPPPMLQWLDRLVGQKLHALHVRIRLTNDRGYKMIGKNYLLPSPIPSLFPNVRYVGWFLIKSVPGDLVGSFSTPNSPLISHIQDHPQGESFGDEATPEDPFRCHTTTLLPTSRIVHIPP